MGTVLYARSSIKTQEHSIDMQKALALEKIQAKGMLFDDMYVDEAVSASKSKIHERPQLNRLIKNIKKGSVSTIYVYKRDRLARNVVQAMELFDLFRSHQVNIVFTADNEIPIQYSPAGEFFELIIAGFNQREANQINQRIKETKYTMTRQGKHAQGRIAYGYRVDAEKRYQIVEEEAEVIRNLFDALIDTGCTNLADFTRAMQLQNRFPSNWDSARIHSLVRNTIYKGIRKIEEFGEYVEIENCSLVIVDENIWAKAQERMNSLKPATPFRSNNRVPMVLDGLLYCGKCGELMIGKKESDITTTTFYTCKAHNYIRQSSDILEKAVLEETANFITQRFQTNFLDVYNLVHGDQIHFFENSILESREAIQDFTKTLDSYTNKWLLNPIPELEQDLLYLHNQIKREELLLQHYPSKLAAFQKQYHLIQSLHASVDLVAEVLSYDDDSRKLLLNDIVHRIDLNAPSLKIQLREPFNGVLGHVTTR